MAKPDKPMDRAMLTRLKQIARKSAMWLTNQLSDIAIAETALKHGAILVTDDAALTLVFKGFGGEAIGSADFPTHSSDR